MKARLKDLRNLVSVLPHVALRDTWKFVHYAHRQGEVRVRLKPAGGRDIVMRGSSFTDRDVFRYVFHEGYHRARHTLRTDAVILDLGANIGLSVVDFKLSHPAATVIAVELDAANCELAKRNTAGLDGVVIDHAAIWHEPTEVRYDSSAAEDAFAAHPDDGEGTAVNATTVAELMEKHGLHRIDYAKIDIEGAEVGLLRHNNEWLSSVDALNIEVHDSDAFSELTEILQAYGFRVRRDDRHWSALLARRSASPDGSAI